jgi:hypothetical protein
VKGVFWKEGEPFTNSMSLIVSLLIRYPEIATLSLNPEEGSFAFSFIFKRAFSPAEIKELRESLTESLYAMLELKNQQPSVLKISCRKLKGFSFLELKRDILSFSQEEITLVIGIIASKYAEEIIKDEDEGIAEEEQLFQEEMIDHMLEDLKDTRQERRLIGIREEGRVMIFNHS